MRNPLTIWGVLAMCAGSAVIGWIAAHGMRLPSTLLCVPVGW